MTNPNTTGSSRGTTIRGDGMLSKHRERQRTNTEIRGVMGYELPQRITWREERDIEPVHEPHL
jgi:hypothetical protein